MDDLLVKMTDEFDTLTQIPKKQSAKLGQT